MKEHPQPKTQEDYLEPNEKSWTDRLHAAAEHPQTGAPKKGSLLRTLAEEALAKGKPVLVIPLDAADPESEPSGSEDEPAHDLRLPKNTTVIFSGKDSLPALCRDDPRGDIKVIEKSGDLGEEARESNCFSGSASPAIPVRVVDPEDPDSSEWNPLSEAGTRFPTT